MGYGNPDRNGVWHNLCCLWDKNENVPDVVDVEDGVAFLFITVEVNEPEAGMHSVGFFHFTTPDSPNKWCAKSPDKHHRIKKENEVYVCVHCHLHGEHVSQPE